MSSVPVTVVCILYDCCVHKVCPRISDGCEVRNGDGDDPKLKHTYQEIPFHNIYYDGQILLVHVECGD